MERRLIIQNHNARPNLPAPMDAPIARQLAILHGSRPATEQGGR
jgi:hypothetical protein